MTDPHDALTIAYLASLQRLGGSGTLRAACDTISSITDLDPTERSLRPVMEHLISDGKLQHLGTDKAAIPLDDVRRDLSSFTAAQEWAEQWLVGATT